MDVLLRAAALVPDMSFLIAGDGPEREALHRQAPPNGQWLGRVPDTRTVYAAAEVIAVPSRQEGQGIVALEAMAAGRPVVASRVGGLAEMLTGGETALLVPPDDPRALAAALGRLRDDPALRARLAANGRALVEAKYDIRGMVAAVERVYRSAADGLTDGRAIGIHWHRSKRRQTMGLLDGKQGIIYGVRNERSLGWGCAQSLAREGARLAFSVFSEREEKDVQKLVGTLPADAEHLIRRCNLTNDEDIAALHEDLKAEFGRLDFVIHAVAFSPKEGVSGRFLDINRAGFQIALDSSTYSFVAAAKAAEPLLSDGSSLITLTYLGAERVLPNYNTMGVAKAALESAVRYLANDLGPQGVRVNAISAGPTMTLAARGIAGFTEMHKESRERAPLRKNTTIDEVGDTCAFLVSDWARGITGETLYVDNGLHILG